MYTYVHVSERSPKSIKNRMHCQSLLLKLTNFPMNTMVFAKHRCLGRKLLECSDDLILGQQSQAEVDLADTTMQ